MPRIVNVLILAVGLSLAISGLWNLKEHSGFPLLLTFGIGLIVVALVSDSRRLKKKKEQDRADSVRRVSELTATPWQPGQHLVIRGSIGMFLIMLLIGVVGTAIFYTEFSKGESARLQYIVLSLLLLPTSLVAMPRVFAEIINPALELTITGIATPIHGQIAWRDITGIDLQQRSYRGHITYILHFRVEQYQKVVKDMHWSECLLAFFGLGAVKRGYISVILKDKREQPDTVYAVARYLWKQATNSDYEWSPMMSNAFNTAARNVGTTLKQHGAMLNTTHLLSVDPHKVLAEVRQVEKDISFMRQEIRQKSSTAMWIMTILLVILFLSIVWPMLNRP